MNPKPLKPSGYYGYGCRVAIQGHGLGRGSNLGSLITNQTNTLLLQVCVLLRPCYTC